MSAALPDDEPAERLDRAIWQLKQANWASFDSPQPSPGPARRQTEALRAALLVVQEEAESLRTRLVAVETSTTWRMTGPLRQALSSLRPKRAPPPAAPPPVAPAEEPDRYKRWIEQCETACFDRLALVLPGHKPIDPQSLGVVLLPGPGGRAALQRLAEACPPDCRMLALIGPGETSPIPPSGGAVVVQTVPAGFQPSQAVGLATRMLDTDLLCFLDPRDELAPVALGLVAGFAARHPAMDVIFADEDWLVEGRRTDPFFKPGWGLELQRGRDLLGPFTFFRTALLRRTVPQAGPAWLYDVANQVVMATREDRILHIPAVLSHRTAPAPAAETLRAATAAQLRREGVAAQVALSDQGGHRVIYQTPARPPLVSVIVPTRDRADLLSVCSDGLLHRTDYPAIELLIVDNGSVDPEALALLDRLAATQRVRVLRHPGAFNWSAINNHAAREAKGDVLLLLNNDIDVLHPDWLRVLVSQLMQPGVGAVGPKLLYPDGRVQHAGLTTDSDGVPRHLYRFAPGDSAGSFGLLACARDVWGVTGACLAVRRDVFVIAGGLNEALPVAYNDVDFCLKLTAGGYRIVWTPWAVLEHRELASRPPDHLSERREQAREELDRLLRDWGRMAIHDRFLNPNLHLEEEQPAFRRG